MLKKICVVGDVQNVPSCSSEIIISNLNRGLKNVGFYDENGTKVVYDCLGKKHGHETNHIICPYETPIPEIVKQNADGAILIGVSNQNQVFFIQGGYPAEKTDVCLLGVDSDFWSPFPSSENDKFTFGMFCDSNTRACYPELFFALSKMPEKDKIRLFIKDRWATDIFKSFVKNVAQEMALDIVYDDNHVTNKERERELYNMVDCHVFLNKSSTFALTVAQGMSMAKPMIVMDYSGPRDYCNSLNSYLVKHSIRYIDDNAINRLKSCGLRNYLLYNYSMFQKQKPYWAIPNIDNLVENLSAAFNKDKNTLYEIGSMARATMKTMTWERSALNLVNIVNNKKF